MSSGSQADPQRSSLEEYARKPMSTSVLALRIKALILAAGLPLPTADPSDAVNAGPARPDRRRAWRADGRLLGQGRLGQEHHRHQSGRRPGVGVFVPDPARRRQPVVWRHRRVAQPDVSRSSFDVCGSEDPDLFALPNAVVPAQLGRLGAPAPARSAQRREDQAAQFRRSHRALPLALRTRHRRHRRVARRVESRFARVGHAAFCWWSHPKWARCTTRHAFSAWPSGSAVRKDQPGAQSRQQRYQPDDLQRTLGIRVACGVVSAGRMMLDAVNEGTTMFATRPGRAASASPRIWPRSSSWSLGANSRQRVASSAGRHCGFLRRSA